MEDNKRKGLPKAVAALLDVKDHVAKTKEESGKIPCQCGGELLSQWQKLMATCMPIAHLAASHLWSNQLTINDRHNPIPAETNLASGMDKRPN